MNRKRYKFYAVIVLITLLAACKKDFFAPSYSEGPVTEAAIWNTDRRVREFLNNGYNYLLAR